MNAAKKAARGSGQTNLLGLIEAQKRDRYLVTIEFIDRVLGGQPKSEEVMRKWLEGKLTREAKAAEKRGQPFPDEEQRQEIIDIQASNMAGQSVDEIIDAGEDRAWTGFPMDEEGPWLGNYQVEACIRDILTSLGITVNKRGLKQTKQHLTQVWACDEAGDILLGAQGRRLRFYKNGELVRAPEGYVEMTAHVMTAQGPRAVLKRHDYIERASVSFLLTTARKSDMAKREGAHLGEKDIAKVLSYMTGNGLGCSRSQGYGKFTVTAFAKLED